MSVMRDSSSDGADAMAAAVGIGRSAFVDGRGPSDAERVDPAFMAGWIDAAASGAAALKAQRETTGRIADQQRRAAVMAQCEPLVRDALEAIRPVLNLCKPAKPNPREQRLIADALRNTDAALAALTRLAAVAAAAEQARTAAAAAEPAKPTRKPARKPASKRRQTPKRR